MRGQKVLLTGGQGPVSAAALRSLAPDNDFWALARFSVPASRTRLESLGVTCIAHHILDPVEGGAGALRGELAGWVPAPGRAASPNPLWIKIITNTYI
jgi:hypothetical protein